MLIVDTSKQYNDGLLNLSSAMCMRVFEWEDEEYMYALFPSGHIARIKDLFAGDMEEYVGDNKLPILKEWRWVVDDSYLPPILISQWCGMTSMSKRLGHK